MKKYFIITVILIILVFLFIDTEEIVNEGEQTYTLMIYLNGSDLETDGGYATTDISEMLNATIDEKINVVIQTGGTNTWWDYDIENNERYTIENGELVLLEDSEVSYDMLDYRSLSEFIDYAKTNYEADRYGLIMWNHGGGAISGFGYDETIESDDSLTLDEMDMALKNTDVNFDFVGFDACLMATIETAYMLNGYSDYLIASEELEPGTGWDYTSLLNGLSGNTDMSTLDFGKVIADSFIESNQSFLFDEEATLSVINIKETETLLSILTSYMNEIDTELLSTQNFSSIARAINKTQKFADGEIDTIDLYHLAQNLENDMSDSLKEQLTKVIEYNNTTSIMENSNGLSIYIPYTNLENYSKMLDIYQNIGINENYINVLSKIANTVAGGQIPTRDLSGDTEYNSDYSDESWYDQNYINDYEEYYESTEYESLEIVDAGDYYMLELSNDDWEVINSITAEVLYDDGEGYIDLGSDNYYELTDDNNLIVSFDGSWISIDGNIVPFYVINEAENYTKAHVPAFLNDEYVNLVIVWDSKNPDGVITGAEPITDYGDSTIENRRLIEIKPNDTIEFLFDYYNYDLEYQDSYIIGDEFIVSDTDFDINYQEVGDGEFYIYYKITDIYNNTYYTEAVILY